MAHFRSRLQIFDLLSLNKNKYNPFLWQQSWHYAKSVCSKKNIIEGCNRRSISIHLSKTPKHYGLSKKTCFSNIQRASSTQKKELAERKLSLWEYVFSPKKSSKNPCTRQLTNCQEQTRSKNLRYQMVSRNVIYSDLIKSKNTRFTCAEPRPKPPPSYKLPRAVFLNKAMIGFPKDDKTCEDKMVTPITPRKPYEEMKPASNSSNTKKTTDQHPNKFRSKNTKSYPPIYEKSTSQMSMIPISDSAEARDITAEILRQAMAQKEPRMHSRIKQLKILVNEMSKSQSTSQIDPGCKNSDK